MKSRIEEVETIARQDSQTFVELFPVQTIALPKLFAYRLDVGGEDVSTIGGKLSYRLRKTFKGHWVWTSNRIVTDTPQTQDEIKPVVENLWREQPNIFKDLREVRQDSEWQPTPLAQAVFVANGLLADIESEIRDILHRKMEVIK